MSNGEDHDAPAIMQWMGQLNLDRPWGAVSSDETCWLCEVFPAWNTVIYALDLELAETASETLSLRFDPNAYENRDFVIAARDISIVVSSLLIASPYFHPGVGLEMRH